MLGHIPSDDDDDEDEDEDEAEADQVGDDPAAGDDD